MAALVSTVVACNKSGYTIEGEMKGFADGTKVYLSKIQDNNLVKVDSTEISNGAFTFEGNTEEVDYTFLEIAEKDQPLQLPFILENGSIKLVADKADMLKTKFSGTKNNDDLAKFNDMVYTSSSKMEKFQQDNMPKFQEASDNNDQATIEALMGEMQKMQNELIENVNKFIDTNKDSYAALMVLSQFANNLPQEEFKTKFNNFSQEVKSTKLGKEISDSLKALETVSVGQKAPDFKAPGVDGKEISLYENLGKVTIIDFWASWCGPCRQENPNVVKLYNQYKDKGLQIIGVSLDKEDAKWKNAITEDQLTWIQMSNLKFWEDPIAKQYNVKSIPATFILDEKGTIIAKDLRGADLENKIAELLK